jgi:hypothetical protein
MNMATLSSGPSASANAWLVAVGALLVTLLVGPTTQAQTPEPAGKDACLAAFQQTQSLKREGKLVQAKEQAIVCSQAHCPDVASTKCRDWVEELETAIPTVVVSAKDASGNDTVSVRLTIDGQPHGDRLDGRPIALDPGEHVIVAEIAGEPPLQQKVAVVQGVKGRPVELSFAHADGGGGGGGGGVSPLVYVGFSIAGAGLIAGAITGGLALSKGGEISDACPDKTCTEEQRDTYDTGIALAHASTACFAIAGAGAVLGVVGLILTFGGSNDQEMALRLAPGSIGIQGTW